MENLDPVNPEHKRKLTTLEKMGVGFGTGAGLTAAFATYSAIKTHFWTREEGDAVSRALAAVQIQMVANNTEQTRVIERKVDKILEFMRDERSASQRDVDRIDRRLENVEFVVMKSPSKNK